MTALAAHHARRQLWARWLLLAALMLALGGTLLWQLYLDQQRTEAQERERLATQTEIIDRNLVLPLSTANRALESLVDDLRLQESGLQRGASSTRHLQSVTEMLPAIRTLMILDANGRVSASNEPALVGKDLGEMADFVWARRELRPGILHMTPPSFALFNGHGVSLMRSRHGADGSFQGVVMATLDPTQFAVLLDSARYTPDAISAVVRGNVKVFLSLPGWGSDASGIAGIDAIVARHNPSAGTHDLVTVALPDSSVKLLASVRTIQSPLLPLHPPLTVVVGRPDSAIYTDWRKNASRSLGLLVVLIAGSCAGLYAYQRRQRIADRRAHQQELERQATERALRENEKRFHALSALSSDWFWQQDEHFRFTEFSGAFASGFSPPAASLGKTRWELNIDLSAEQWAAHRALLDAHLPFREFEYPITSADGEIRWYSINGEPRFDAAGKFIGYQGTGRNITTHKQTEQELRIAAAAFESQEGMIVTDGDGVILRVNRALTEMTGYSAQELVGRTPRMLLSERHDTLHYEAMWDGVARSGGWQGEVWNRRKNGEEFPVWQTITSVKDAQGVVTHFVATQTDITQRIAAQAAIENLAFYDPLTRLPNRRLLIDRVQQAMGLCRRTQQHGALLFIDLDNFKSLNDTLGHNVGDLLLQQVAQRLSHGVREGDTVARLGGDEFVVMLENLSEKPEEAAAQAESVGEKIHATLNQTYTLGTQPHHSTPSIGIALFHQQNESVDDLLKQADLAMYQAKKSGRNALRFFDPEMQRGVAARVALEADLRAALKEGQFRLHYQPQVDGQGRLKGVEALLRWHHPARGLVPPAEFIPLAEETGLILPLGQWVLESACAQLAAWNASPPTSHLSVAVNISARQLHQEEFVAQVLAALEHAGASAQHLKLELTESLLLSDVEDTIVKMADLKQHGVYCSLDDFGTGYSSLSYLKRLPLEQLKIDRSFVRDVLVDANDAVIIRTIVALAQSMGLSVIAEGVETEEQRQALAQAGCHAYQGYLFGRPAPAEELQLPGSVRGSC